MTPVRSNRRWSAVTTGGGNAESRTLFELESAKRQKLCNVLCCSRMNSCLGVNVGSVEGLMKAGMAMRKWHARWSVRIDV